MRFCETFIYLLRRLGFKTIYNISTIFLSHSVILESTQIRRISLIKLKVTKNILIIRTIGTIKSKYNQFERGIRSEEDVLGDNIVTFALNKHLRKC